MFLYSTKFIIIIYYYMVIEVIATTLINLISQLSYSGIFIAMVMESMIIPVPSEIIMPFAGFLIADSRLTFIGVLIASTLGSLIGSLISYYMGKYGGRPLIIKYGKYLLLNKHHLESTENLFAKKGEKTIFISRFIPIIRHLISIPAGIARMNIKKFMFYTIIGSTMWNMFLAFLGYKLKENWDLIHKFSVYLDILLLVILIILFVYTIKRKFKK